MRLSHISPNHLLALSDGVLSPSRTAELESHLQACGQCQNTRKAMDEVGGVIASPTSAPVFDVGDAILVRLQEMHSRRPFKLIPAAFVVGSILLAAVTILAAVPTVRSAIGDSPATHLFERLGIRIVDKAPTSNDERVVILSPEPLTEADVIAHVPDTLLPEYVPAGYAFSNAFATPGSVSLFYQSEPRQRPLEIVQIRLPIGPGGFVDVLEGKATPVQIGDLSGVYVDGAWVQASTKEGTPVAPAQWTSEFGQFLLFDREGLRIYVFGPTSLTKEELVRVAESLR